MEPSADLPSPVGVMASKAHWKQRPTTNGRPRPIISSKLLYIQLVSKVSRLLQISFLDSRIEDFDLRYSIFNLATLKTSLEDVRDFNCAFDYPKLPRNGFVCNLIVVRLDYSQGCLELKKKEQSRATNWGLFGAID
ncbi:hypothetical protein M9H77_02128 [Catharanthus roseus]|uniref:Uncharacterized protein n=1 Tax=Catharanthus roseus TaxID=4058 RepID=A0ACC0C7L2_CATRO|nr:hypothetical protein M9H77_02128 [Catharanthus roseus]